MQTALETIIIEPKQPATHSVIWLHGLGADGGDFVPVVEQLDLSPSLAVKFIFPTAPTRPVTMNGGMPMPAWFDIQTMDLLNNQDEAGIRQAQQQIMQLVNAEIAQGRDSRQILLAGFSQGGALALFTALSATMPLAGVMGLSTLLPVAEKVKQELSKENQQLPIFLAHGKLDSIVSVNLGLMTREQLVDCGYQVEWREYMMDHSVCAEEIRDISQFMNRVLV